MIFYRGVAVGLALACAVLALLAGGVQRRGLTVSVDGEPLFQRMEAEIAQTVRSEVPGALAAARTEVTAQVSAQVGQRLREMRLEVAGLSVPVPPAAVRQVEDGVAKAMRAGLDGASQAVDAEALAARVSRRATAVARERAASALAAEPVVVQVMPGFRVPVRIRLHTGEGAAWSGG